MAINQNSASAYYGNICKKMRRAMKLTQFSSEEIEAIMAAYKVAFLRFWDFNDPNDADILRQIVAFKQPSTILHESFSWGATSQGYGYWQAIHNRISHIRFS